MSQLASDQTAPPGVLQESVQALRCSAQADVAWLAVRESRSRSVVICCADGARSSQGLGLRIEPGNSAGGLVLHSGDPWRGNVDDGRSLSPAERSILMDEGIVSVMVVPIREKALLPGETRLQGLTYLGRRRLDPFSDEALASVAGLGERLARPIRDAWRLHETICRWVQAGASEASNHETAVHRLDELAQLIAGDVRVLLRSIVGMVFRLDRGSGALHAVGFDGLSSGSCGAARCCRQEAGPPGGRWPCARPSSPATMPAARSGCRPS